MRLDSWVWTLTAPAGSLLFGDDWSRHPQVQQWWNEGLFGWAGSGGFIPYAV